MSFTPLAERTHEQMRDVMMDPTAPGPTVHYYMIRGGSKKRNITVWESGTVGGEYIKTYGHYHIGDISETYRVLEGEGIVLLQKVAEENGVPVADRVAEFKVVRVKAGNSVRMPAGYGHVLVNTGGSQLVTIDSSPVEGPDNMATLPGRVDYEMVRQMRGFAYYVVEKDGTPVLVRNPRYREIAKTDFGGLKTADVPHDTIHP